MSSSSLIPPPTPRTRTLLLLQLARSVASRLRRACGGAGSGPASGPGGPRRSEGVWRVPLLWVAVLEAAMGDAMRATRVLSMQVWPCHPSPCGTVFLFPPFSPRYHSLGFTGAQGVPKYQLGLGRGKDGRVWGRVGAFLSFWRRATRPGPCLAQCLFVLCSFMCTCAVTIPCVCVCAACFPRSCTSYCATTRRTSVACGWVVTLGPLCRHWPRAHNKQLTDGTCGPTGPQTTWAWPSTRCWQLASSGWRLDCRESGTGMYPA